MTQWKTGLFGCFEDIPICVIGAFVPCWLFGQNAEQIDGSGKIQMCAGCGALSCCSLCCVLHKPRRKTLRAQYNIVEEPNDLLATCCCSSCAICQEAREMKQRGVLPGGRITTQPR